MISLTYNMLLVKSNPYKMQSWFFDFLNCLKFQIKKTTTDSEKAKFTTNCKYVMVKHFDKDLVFVIKSTPILDIPHARPHIFKIILIIFELYVK